MTMPRYTSSHQRLQGRSPKPKTGAYAHPEVATLRPRSKGIPAELKRFLPAADRTLRRMVDHALTELDEAKRLCALYRKHGPDPELALDWNGCQRELQRARKKVAVLVMRLCESPSLAADMAGVGMTALIKWQADDPDFAYALKAARIGAGDRLTERLYEEVYSGGKMGVVAAIFLLKGQRPWMRDSGPVLASDAPAASIDIGAPNPYAALPAPAPIAALPPPAEGEALRVEPNEVLMGHNPYMEGPPDDFEDDDDTAWMDDPDAAED